MRSGNAVEQTYRRGTALAKRRTLMEAWASHCIGGVVVPFQKRGLTRLGWMAWFRIQASSGGGQQTEGPGMKKPQLMTPAARAQLMATACDALQQVLCKVYDLWCDQHGRRPHANFEIISMISSSNVREIGRSIDTPGCNPIGKLQFPSSLNVAPKLGRA
jgi:hypothetical protein